MDYHWDDEKAVIILDDEMSEFELADAQSERKLVKYVIGITLLLINLYIGKRLSASFCVVAQRNNNV